MNHLVAVGANRAQILNRIYLRLASNFGSRNEVMNLNKPRTELAVTRLEVETTHGTLVTIVSNALGSRSGITLVPSTDLILGRTFKVCLLFERFFR